MFPVPIFKAFWLYPTWCNMIGLNLQIPNATQLCSLQLSKLILLTGPALFLIVIGVHHWYPVSDNSKQHAFF